VVQDNERVAREIADAITHRDLSRLQAISTEDFEYVSAITAERRKTYRGKQGWAAYLADVESLWDDLQIEIGEVLTVGPDTVVAALRIKAQPRGGGAPIDEGAFTVARFREGKAVRADTYLHRPKTVRVRRRRVRSAPRRKLKS
jgi:ketosteroid isomerase-like protein